MSGGKLDEYKSKFIFRLIKKNQRQKATQITHEDFAEFIKVRGIDFLSES